MDPEDVLDFGEDDDGLDVISLGGSDHDGRPVSQRSSSTLPDYASRGTPHVRPSSPSRSRNLKSPRPTLNGSERSRRQSASRTQNPHQVPPPGRRNHYVLNSNRPQSHTDRPVRETSSRESNRHTMVEAPRSRLPNDRPKPGERASYMPPDRLQALSRPSRTSDSVDSNNYVPHSVSSLSARITDHRPIQPKLKTCVSLSKLMHESAKPEEEKIEAKNRVCEETIEFKKSTPLDKTIETKKPDHPGETTEAKIPIPLEKTTEAKKPIPLDKTIETKKTVSEETKELMKPSCEGTKDIKKPDRSTLDPSGERLPEGWISRISKAGKTYYVNVFTRTSQWARPTEPAIAKQLKPTVRVTSKSSDVQPVQPETLENSTDPKPPNPHKPDLIDTTESSSVVSRSHKQGPNPQTASQPVVDSSDKPRPPNKAAAQDDAQHAKVLEQVRHPETYKAAEHGSRRSNLTGSGSTPDFSHHIGTRSIPQERPQSATSDPYPKGPRIHPDRRQEIVAANLHPPSSDRTIRQEPRRYPQEPGTLRARANPGRRSASPDLRYVSSHRPLEHHPREPVQLSGANGIPKGPGRSFPDRRISLRSSQDFDIHPDSSRYSKNAFVPCMPARELLGHRNADWWRGPPDDSLNRKIVSPDRIHAQWSSRPASPVYPSHRHRLSSRARSPSPLPRRVSSHQDLQRGPFQPDLHRAERFRPPPISNRTLQEDWSSRTPQSSDLMRRNTTARFDTYRPSSSSPMVTNRPQDSRRIDPCPSRDQGPRHVDHSEVVPMRTQPVKQLPFSTDLPKTSSGPQPDFYRPPPRGTIASKQSSRCAPPSKDDAIIDLDGVLSKDEIPLRPLTEKDSNNLPSESAPRGNPTTEVSHSSLLQGLDRAQDFGANNSPKIDVEPLANVASEPRALVAPISNKSNQATCVSSCEKNDATQNGMKAPSDVMISLSPTAVSPKKTVPLVKRLGPVAAYSSESDSLTPPTKKHRRNPVEKSETVDASNVLPDNSKSSSLEQEQNLCKNTDRTSKDAAGQNKNQSEAEEQINRMDGVPESPPEVPHDKVISVRGRAARQSGDVGADKHPWSKIEEETRSESTPTVGGSLRDRIQDLNIPSARPIRSRQFPHTDSLNHNLQRSLNDTHQARPRVEEELPPSRHISDRISAFRAPMNHSPSSNGNYRSPRYVTRQSDSGWGGRRGKYP